MNLDIQTGVKTAFYLAIGAVFLFLYLGIRSISEGSKLLFFRKRRDLMLRGWRMILGAVGLVGAAFLLNQYAEPVAYRFFPPSPTVTMTPTITLTPTITQTPTITVTPSITITPLYTNTPELPPEILGKFTSEVTPIPETLFSPITVALELDENFLPVEPAIEYENPVPMLYGAFSYDQMASGAQWTAVWVRLLDNTVICYETKPWDGSTGGYGYTDCAPPSDIWQPGEYDVRIFIGQQFITSGRFIIAGEVPTLTATPTASRTPTVSPTPTITRTPTQTSAPTRTATPRPSATITRTPTATLTRTATFTPTKTRTLPPTSTMRPTLTPRPTDTQWPTLTPEN
ncbi:MAG: hypothetical protein GYA48_04405 [Chloroflexi bacterium]|nr:hypothetical protein [Chloroflexota bacterium]